MINRVEVSMPNTTLVTSGEPDAIVLPEVFPGTRLTAITAAGKMTGWSMPKSAYESEAMQKYIDKLEALK